MGHPGASHPDAEFAWLLLCLRRLPSSVLYDVGDDGDIDDNDDDDDDYHGDNDD